MVLSVVLLMQLCCAQTEWSSNPEPAGVTCTDIYAPGSPRIANYHDTAAQASFAAKAVYLIDGMFPLFSYWAFSDICAYAEMLEYDS